MQHAKRPLIRPCTVFGRGKRLAGCTHCTQAATVNSLAGGDEVYFYRSRQTEETHWQADAQVEASGRDGQSGSETDRDAANQVDGQTGGHRCKQTGCYKPGGRNISAHSTFYCGFSVPAGLAWAHISC